MKYHERREIASGSNDADVLDRMSHDVDPEIREAVARNPYCSTDTRTRLMRDTDSCVRSTAFQYAKKPHAVFLDIVVSDPDQYVRKEFAEITTSPAVLTALAKDVCCRVRSRVAGNRNTPTEVLADLLAEGENMILCALGGNTNMTSDLLDAVIEHPDALSYHIWQIAKHPNTSNATLLKMASRYMTGSKGNNSSTSEAIEEAIDRRGGLLVLLGGD